MSDNRPPIRWGIDVITFAAVARFTNQGDQTLRVMQGPPAAIGEADVMFELLSQLSKEQRVNLISLSLTQVDGDALAMMFDNNNGIYNFSPCYLGAEVLDGDVCPGCGIFLGGALNPLCHHPDGCEKYCSMKDATPLEELEDDQL